MHWAGALREVWAEADYLQYPPYTQAVWVPGGIIACDSTSLKIAIELKTDTML